MDLGWSTVHASPPVKGGLVCVLPHLVFAWMKLPLKVAYVDKGSCSMGGKSGWSGGNPPAALSQYCICCTQLPSDCAISLT